MVLDAKKCQLCLLPKFGPLTVDHPPMRALPVQRISYKLDELQRKYVVFSYDVDIQVVDLHAGPSNICRALSHRECHGNESKREAHELRLKGVQHCKAGALAGKEKGDQNPGCISTIWGLQV